MGNPTDSRRILIVEDEPLIAMLVQEWLEELNCTTIGPATSVGGALELIAGVALDGAVLDVSLGKEESFPIADELRKRDVPFVFATGYGVDGLESRFAGALVLSKPFEYELFCDVVGKMLVGRPGT
ncbi:MAG: response regulator [Hyphomicrobiaceae bacterium]